MAQASQAMVEVEVVEGVPQARDEAIRRAIEGFIGELQKTADLRVRQRYDVEQRWIESLRQYHGRYDHATMKRLSGDDTKSKVFVNKTRRKTNAMAARLHDMLFPTDDRNWGIQPTPVPELVVENEERQSAAAKAQAAVRGQELEEGAAQPGQATEGAEAAPMSPKMQELKATAAALQAHAEELQALMDVARRSCDLMQQEIEDKLKACGYQAACRDQIDWACKIGTGVIKGPVTGAKMNPRWKRPEKRGEDGRPILDAEGRPQIEDEYVIQQVAETEPSFVAVDPWSYFPDMESGPNVADGDGDMVRHLMSKKALRQLAQRPGFDPDAIRRLLKDNPRGAMPTYLNDLREITGDTMTIRCDNYQVWEYCGPVTAEHMRDSALWMGDSDLLADAEEADPLRETYACVWFCQGELLYFGPYPLDSNESLYSVFCVEKDEVLPFGYGVPDMIRDAQKVFNAAWRLIMDNATLSAGPQIVVNPDVVEPYDGDWNIVPRKLWRLKSNIAPNSRAFDIFDIPTRQPEIQAIIEMASGFIDEESGISQIAEGEQGADVTKTVAGMAMLMNSSNILLRRIVRNYDDDVTVPNIRRMYHFMMQHSPKREIKGDYQVDARGSTVLLVRELQQQNLIAIANLFGAHPVFGKMIKAPELLRAIFGAMMIPADQLVKSDSEIQAAEIAEQKAMEAQQAAGGAGAGPNPELEQAKIDLEREKIDKEVLIANQKSATDRFVAQMRRDVEMARIAELMNMKVTELEAKVATEQAKIDSDERKFGAEAAMTMRRDAMAQGEAERDRAEGRSEAERDRAENRTEADKDRKAANLPATGGGYL